MQCLGEHGEAEVERRILWQQDQNLTNKEVATSFQPQDKTELEYTFCFTWPVYNVTLEGKQVCQAGVHYLISL